MKSRKQNIEEILENFRSIRRQVAHEGHQLKGLGITMTQASVLFLIKQNGELTLTEIAKRLGVSKSAATQLTEALIEQNLLIKKPDTIDRRVSRLTLSPKCGQQLKVFRTQAMSGLAKIFENLEDNELEELKKITNKLAEKGETDNV